LTFSALITIYYEAVGAAALVLELLRGKNYEVLISSKDVVEAIAESGSL